MNLGKEVEQMTMNETLPDEQSLLSQLTEQANSLLEQNKQFEITINELRKENEELKIVNAHLMRKITKENEICLEEEIQALKGKIRLKNEEIDILHMIIGEMHATQLQNRINQEVEV